MNDHDQIELEFIAALKTFSDKHNIDPPRTVALLSRALGRIIAVNSENDLQTGENVCEVIKLADIYARSKSAKTGVLQ